jgi:ABC-type oligopeptide transport system ATPase subunit
MSGACPFLELREVSKSYPARGTRDWSGAEGPAPALDRVSFAVRPGESFGLIGESGSGKTTAARCALGLLAPDQGEVLIEGKEIRRMSRRERLRVSRRIGAVFQDPVASLNPRLRVHRLIEEPLLVHRLGDRSWRRERVGQLLRQVGLSPEYRERLPGELSGGERQRVAIARALAGAPVFLVADEPLSSLEIPLQGQILELLAGLREQLGLGMLFISHALPLVRRVCERAAVMHRGRIVEMAGVAELFRNPCHPCTRSLLDQPTQATGRGGEPATSPGPLREIAPGHWALL